MHQSPTDVEKMEGSSTKIWRVAQVWPMCRCLIKSTASYLRPDASAVARTSKFQKSMHLARRYSCL